MGTLRLSPADGTRVWALGEGAVAWLALAMSRLAAAFAAHAEVLGEAAIDMTVTSPGHAVQAAPIEVWNHADRTYGPAGGRRLADIAPSRCAVDLTTCLSADLARTARPLVMGLLRQFDLSESRHIDPAGIIQRRHFTGHDESILAWTQAIGVPSAA
ncbi:hypothetical protein [Spongiactinospora sp. TRM90649]|uniref:hypothetical protein n=1 Tax=Spongiactinospora sp. TRM90649 TaxID=3031114 RepID=UPI0023F8EAFD|nr:hypothetical protein [Spongiactinospora sp. TRM90649]MDF5753458.1 hypothetical protein [Spongiactinospora sp. TRM90649]